MIACVRSECEGTIVPKQMHLCASFLVNHGLDEGLCPVTVSEQGLPGSCCESLSRPRPEG